MIVGLKLQLNKQEAVGCSLVFEPWGGWCGSANESRGQIFVG